MQTLKRLLRPACVRPLLASALALAPAGSHLAVLEEDRPLLWTGDEPPAKSPAFCVALRCQNHVRGRLCVYLPEGTDAFLTARAEDLAEVLRQSLDALIASELGRRSVAAETLDKYREIELLHQATQSLNTSLRLRDVTRALIAECRRSAIPAQMGIVFLKEKGAGSGQHVDSFGPAPAVGLDGVRASRLYREAMARSVGEIVNELSTDPRWNREVPAIHSLLIIPLISPNLLVGSLVLASAEPGAFTAEHLKRISTIAATAATAMGNAYHYERTRVLMDALLQALAAAIDARDPMTAGHSLRVAGLSVALARHVNADFGTFADFTFSESELHEIFYAGLLHDVGKIGIREEVLTKKTRLTQRNMDIIAIRLALHGAMSGRDWRDDMQRLEQVNAAPLLADEDAAYVRELAATNMGLNGCSVPLLAPVEAEALLIPSGNLTREERREIERHPDESFRILQHIPFTEEYRQLLAIIQQHHERLDGSGYPQGLTAEAICIQARILAVTDIYDAITQERHYKPALPRDEALKVLRDEAAAGRIDPALVELFCSRIGHITAQADAVGDAVRGAGSGVRPPALSAALDNGAAAGTPGTERVQ